MKVVNVYDFIIQFVILFCWAHFATFIGINVKGGISAIIVTYLREGKGIEQV